MLQAGCIYLGLTTPCPETSHPLHLPRTYHPCPGDLSPPTQNLPPRIQTNAISIKDYPKRSTRLPHKSPFKYEASLIPLALSLVVRPTAAAPCLNKGNLPPLRLSLLFCLGRNYTVHSWCGNRERARHLSLSPSHCFPFSRNLGAWTPAEFPFCQGS